MDSLHEQSLGVLLQLPDRLEASLELVRLFAEATAMEREEWSRRWPFEVSWSYPSPWRLACRQGERWSPPHRILTTLVIGGLSLQRDPREAQILFCVAYNSCLLASLKPEDVFAHAAGLLPESAASGLLSFLRRSPGERSLDSFLLEIVSNEVGEPELRPRWQGAS